MLASTLIPALPAYPLTRLPAYPLTRNKLQAANGRHIPPIFPGETLLSNTEKTGAF